MRGRGIGILQSFDNRARARHLQRFEQALFNEVVPRLLRATRRNFAGNKKSWIRILRHLPQAVTRFEEPEPLQYFRAVVAKTVELVSRVSRPTRALREQIAFGQPTGHVRVVPDKFRHVIKDRFVPIELAFVHNGCGCRGC